MKLAGTLTKYPSIMYVVGGVLLGLYLGYRMLPSLLPRESVPISAEELQPILAVQQQLEAKLAASVVAIDGIADAQVQLSTSLPRSRGHNKASVTVAISAEPFSDVQVAAITEQVASGVDGLASGNITVIDAAGRTLNLHAMQQYAQEQFWTNLALNVTKILAIIAATITVRFIVQAIHKRLLGETQGC